MKNDTVQPIPLILASTSARRHELLKLLDVNFDVMAVHIDETWQMGEHAQDYILRMVDTKSAHAAQMVEVSAALVLTADTIGVLPDNEVLTKPSDKQDAFRMWHKLSGNLHEVWTAVKANVVVDGQIVWQKSTINKTIVHFAKMSKQDMENYWQTGEPIDKAGAYAIQGKGARFVQAIDGNYTNVVGLPLPDVVRLIDNAYAFIKTTSLA